MKVIPIGSGKGGVGKSLLSANLSVALAQRGKTVTLIDLDLGGSNLHLLMGMRGIPEGIGTFLKGTSSWNDIQLPTEYPNLTFIAGDTEMPELANLTHSQKVLLIKSILSLKTDYVIIDLGAGTSFSTIDFFLISNRGIVITTPTLTATMNAYLFLKNALFRIMHFSFKKGSVAHEMFESLKADGASLQRLYIPKFIEKIKEEDPLSYQKLSGYLKAFKPSMVFNWLTNEEDLNKAVKIRTSSRQYLGLDLQSLGTIYKDNWQDMALASRLPVIIYKKESLIAKAVYRIADKILELDSQYSQTSYYPLSTEEIQDSYELSAMEAQNDYASKMQFIKSIAKNETLTPKEMMELIESQQQEISDLRKQNNLFKLKLKKAVEKGFKI